VEFQDHVGERLTGSAEESDIRATPEIVRAWERKKRVAELKGSDPFELLPHQDCELTRYAHEITLVQLKRSEAVKANIAVQMRPYGPMQEEGVEIDAMLTSAMLRLCKRDIPTGKKIDALKKKNTQRKIDQHCKAAI
jgi:hypothetical protein